ncbi:MAG: ThiF family adenylyltransferase [Sedimentisphaerales bacterium]|nr:ThiF family adenylyltransferase [Sedimentisphaerales bacterium]
MNTTLMFDKVDFDALKQEFSKDQENEQFAMALCEEIIMDKHRTLYVRQTFFPDKDDLSEQSSCGVAPTHEFQAIVYLVAQKLGYTIVDIHTHPFSQSPTFSSIDWKYGRENAKYITEHFEPPITLAKVVSNSSLTYTDCVVFDRDTDDFEDMNFSVNETQDFQKVTINYDPMYDRQRLIPGWDQDKLSRIKAAVVGLGGTGSQLFQSLISIGVGTKGWISGIDPDNIEETNLPRIPYAYREHIGSPKVTVAGLYAGKKNPYVKYYPYPCSVNEKVVKSKLKEASVIFCAPDNDGVRKVCNDLAVEANIPLIDTGCDIRVNGDKVEAGGQVRIVIPKINACLVCSRGYDPSAAAIALLNDKEKAEYASAGYVIGSDENPVPSIATLNAITAQLAMTAFLMLVYGSIFGNWDYLYYDLAGNLMKANTTHKTSCPLCGERKEMVR